MSEPEILAPPPGSVLGACPNCAEPIRVEASVCRDCSRPIPQGLKMILSRCEIHRGLHHRGVRGRDAGGRIPWPDPDLKPDAERDFPGSVPIRLAHLPKDGNAKARRAISTLTAEVAELQEENKKLLDQLVAAGSGTTN